VNELTHPGTSFSSATWYALRIAASFDVIGEYSFFSSAYQTSFAGFVMITTRQCDSNTCDQQQRVRRMIIPPALLGTEISLASLRPLAGCVKLPGMSNSAEHLDWWKRWIWWKWWL